MKKISKKIVSLVTMAAFVLTLVPVAAFAAGDPTTVDSRYKVAAGTNAGELVVTVNLANAGGVATTNCNTPKVQVTVAGAEDNTVVATNSTTTACTTAKAAADGVNAASASTAELTFTYKGLSAGNHAVTVMMDQDGDGNSYGYEALKVADNEAGSAYVSDNASAMASQLVLVDQENDKSVTIDPEDGPLTAQFDVYDASGVNVSQFPLSDATAGTKTYTYVWVTTTQDGLNGAFTDAIAFADGGENDTKGKIRDTDNAYVKSVNAVGRVNDSDAITLNLNRAGTYYVYAGVSTVAPGSGAGNVVAGANAATAFGNNISLVGDPITVTVNPETYDVQEITLAGSTNAGTIAIAPNADGDGYTWDIAGDGVAANGTKVYEVTGKATRENGQAAQYVNLNLDVNKSGLVLSDEQVSTDKNGEFSFTFTVTKADIFKIDVTEDGNDKTSVELTVNKDEVVASNITTIEDGGIMLAGDDDKYVNDVYGEAPTLMSDAVQFEITDTNGNEVVGGNLPAYKILVTGAPADSELKDETFTGEAPDDALSLAWDDTNEVWTLAYDKVGRDIAKDLLAGEYTVRVAFNDSTQAATATFTLAEFGEVQGLVFNGADEVVLGEDITGSVSYVDEQGIKVPVDADDVLVTAEGAALAPFGHTANADDFTFATRLYSIDNEAYYGTTITLTAFDETIPDLIQKEVTVVAATTDYSLAFDPTNGPANENNRVEVSVVDEDGNVNKDIDNATMHAYVVSSSDETAKVDVTPAAVNNGKGALTIYSDKETTLDIAVVVVTANDEAIYAGNLDYTVGPEDVVADETTVVMTIGSSDIVVNNDFVTGDAAPYIDENWRTMVPYRVLGETFGATVTWNGEDQTITAVDGDTTLVMTIGETTYTVNGTEYTMDTAPVIGENDRTYVPGRFFAEALGYEVTTLKDANGLTAGVVFQK